MATFLREEFVVVDGHADAATKACGAHAIAEGGEVVCVGIACIFGLLGHDEGCFENSFVLVILYFEAGEE